MDIELQLLNLISENEKINQRTIAQQIGLSLGTINSMLKSLEEKNYLIISRAANHSARYLLTEEGRALRSEKLYLYIVECSEMITRTRVGIKSLLLKLCSQRIKNFYLSEAEDELYRIVLLILMELSRKQAIAYFSELPEQLPEQSVILGWTKENPHRGKNNYIHLMQSI